MELRVLKYFLTIADEGNISKAADVLHITQPTLSRQLAALESELNTKLFLRMPRHMILTEDGMILKKRAEEMIALHDKSILELRNDSSFSGEITVACGDLAAVSTFVQTVSSFRKIYPNVRFSFRTANADVIKEGMEKGLYDIGILLNPIDVERFSYIKLQNSEEFVVIMSPDSHLSSKDAISPEDLKDLPLIIPRRSGVRAEIASWLGSHSDILEKAFSSDLPSTSIIMVIEGLGYAILINGSGKYWSHDNIVLKPLMPPLKASTVIAWRKGIATPRYINAFIEFMCSTLDVK